MREFSESSLNAEESKEERKKHIISLFEAGMDAKDCIGYHGTSLQAVKLLIENGFLSGSKFEHIKSDANWLYFYPKERKEGREKENLEIIKEAGGYAEDVAKEHCLLEEIGLDLSSVDDNVRMNARHLASRNPNDVNDPNAEYRFFRKLGISKRTLDGAVKSAKKRKGVVLAISDRILTSHSVLHGDYKGEDLRIEIPEGLKMEFLCGIEPMGDEEWNYFEELKAEIGGKI